MEVVAILLDVNPGIDPENLDADTSLSRDLGMGEAQKRTVATQTNARFGLSMSEAECEELDTIGQLVSYVEAHIK